MSNSILNAVFQRSKTRHSARLLMLALADRCNDSGTAWPSIADLMHRTQLSRGAIHTAMSEAVRLGELSVSRHKGQSLCNLYQITIQTRSDSEPVQELNIPVQILDMTRSDSEPKPSYNQKNPKSIAQRSKTTKVEGEGFDAFWKAYPRKVAKGAAVRAWRATAKDRPPLAELLAALDRHRTSKQWQDAQFIPYCGTWLRGERWNDELPRACSNGGLPSCL